MKRAMDAKWIEPMLRGPRGIGEVFRMYRFIDEITALDIAHKRSKRALRQQAKCIKRLKEENDRLYGEIEDNEAGLICLSNHMRILDKTIARLTEERDDARRALKEQSKEFYETTQRNKDLEFENSLNHRAIDVRDEIMWQRDKFEEERDALKEERDKLKTTLEHAVEQLDYKTEQLENEHELRVRAIEELEYMKRQIGSVINKLNEVM